MTIQSTDIVLYESERMTDEATGGGRPTGRKIPDYTLNAIFPKTSRLDRTEGRFNMAKVFAGVDVATAEPYQGSHFAITKDAADAYVNVLAIPGTPTDMRSEARARIEEYLVPGVDARLWLLGDQYAGQRVVLMYQEQVAPLPELGSTLYLVQKDKAGTTTATEYIKIASYTYADQIFTYILNGEIKTLSRRVLTIKLSARLKNTLTGGTPFPTGTQVSGDIPAARVYNTNVADTAQFYGVTALAVAAAAGATSIKVAEVYKPIVPAAYSENILTEQLALGQVAKMAQSGAAQSVALTFALVAGNQSRAFLPRLPMRGLQLSIDSGVYRDDGSGILRFVSGTDNYSQITVSYETGQIDAYRKTSVYTSSATASYTPAARLLGAAISTSTAVTVANRTFSWVWSYPDTPPEFGTLVIWYRALGKWQVITEDGTGKLTGAGSGSLTAAGTISATFSALPDAESTIVIAFQPAGALAYTQLSGTVQIPKKQKLTLPNVIKPSSLTITWTASGAAKTAHDNGSGGLTGDVSSGTVTYAARQVEFVPTALPDNGTYSVSYTKGPYNLATVTVPTDAAAQATFSAGKPLTAGKSVISYPVSRFTSRGQRETVQVTLVDDGAGKLLRDGTQVGTIDYAAGTGTFSWARGYNYNVTYYKSSAFGGMAKQVESVSATETQAGNGTLQGLPSNEPDGVAESITANMSELTFSLGSTNLVSESLQFSDGTNTFVERDGVIWKNPDPRTNAGTRVGAVELASGQVTIADPKGMATSVTIVAGASLQSAPFIQSAVWRTPGSPLKSGNFVVKGTAANGDVLTAEAAASGDISGALGTGRVDIATGLISMTLARSVAAGSLSYSTVILTALPLDSESIGLDPVRLPPDGKVPIFADGVGIIVGHTAKLDIATPTAGQQIDCGRDYLAEIWITGANGKKLAYNQYTENRDTGMVTMSASLSLVDADGAAVTTPLTLHHRIEHRTLLQDVQPSGELSLAIPLAQDYPAGESYVSSYIRQGDRFASWSNVFAQQSWDASNPNWGHVPVGPSITADYNEVDFPLEVTNKGTIDEEWLLQFTSTTTFNLIGKDRGLISSGNITTDLSPINPNTGTPYFVMRKGGFSAGWATGNVVRFTTRSALAPIWLLRCVSIGVATHPDDEFEYMQYGDAD